MTLTLAPPLDVDPLYARVRAYSAREMPALAGARVVLATSGGADSAALVALLCESGVAAPARAVAAHFDHALRGDDAAARDLAAVRALAARYGLPLVVGRWGAPRAGEAAARDARYAFLRTVADQHGCPYVATGHTRDDQVETVLMRIMRGAGAHGLAGMRPLALLPGAAACRSRDGSAAQREISIARPLLGISREDTRAVCASRGIAFEDDATNADLRFLRNRVRLEALPALRAHDARIDRRFIAASLRARRAADAGDRVAVELMRSAERPLPDELHLARSSMLAISATAAHAVYRMALSELLGDPREYARRHYETMLAASSARTGATFELPRGVVLTVDAGALVLSLGPPGPPPLDLAFEAQLPFSGVAGAWRIDVNPRGDGEVRLPAGAILRARRPGDRITTASGHHRKLHDAYTDARIPRRHRDAAPIIARGRDVLWSPLIRLYGSVAPRDETFRIVASRP